MFGTPMDLSKPWCTNKVNSTCCPGSVEKWSSGMCEISDKQILFLNPEDNLPWDSILGRIVGHKLTKRNKFVTKGWHVWVQLNDFDPAQMFPPLTIALFITKTFETRRFHRRRRKRAAPYSIELMLVQRSFRVDVDDSIAGMFLTMLMQCLQTQFFVSVAAVSLVHTVG